MLKLPALLLTIGYGVVLWFFSAWRLKRQMDATATPLADPELEREFAKMARVLDVERIRVHVHEVDPVNGLAAPDGRIFITRGFLRKFHAGEVSAPEMASVVAHELGHVALGHARRRLIDFSGQNAIRVVLSGMLGRVVPGVGPYLANVLASLVAARLSRQDEYEADAYASALLVKAGIGTAPQKTLFGKLSKLTGMGGVGMPAWLMSHPKTEERIAAIETLEARWGIEGPPR
ncbi:M48 family metallopeptidase [Jannaschia seohaensis]|uniref:Putative metalloprotease n=1 Tax=Jannaschia seohaensis TaxID=475081 RepID=A0A2Y9B260_9RHOB|nr:M48 family metallopeptidase [Jannaschia seohaensis]PWJ13294.1 putative metalloprotease [Jannaschia seohaensis]SSA50620.1 putative metalloprotease [Jannaschia seohaensis]